MKHCNKCNQDLPYESFQSDSSRKDGYDPYCKECRNKIKETWRNNNREKVKSNARKWRESHREELREKDYYNTHKGKPYIIRASNKIAAIILAHPEHKCECCKCGETDIHIIDLHHTNPDEKDTGMQTLAHRKWSLVAEEAKKCIPVCRNCHGKIHRNKEKFDLLQEEIQKEVTRKLLEVNILRENSSRHL